MGAKFIGSAGPKTTIFSFESILWLLWVIWKFILIGLANKGCFCYIAANFTLSRRFWPDQ
jgi:hypothetical protein